MEVSIWIFLTMLQQAWLVLEDGTVYEGYGLGSSEDAIGELVSTPAW